MNGPGERPPMPPMPPLAQGAPLPPIAGPTPRRAEAGKVLPFRRGRQVSIRRRSKLAGLTKYFLGALSLVGAPAAAVVWVSTAPQFAVQRIDVVGASRVDRAQVEARLATLKGQNLFWLHLPIVPAMLSAEPWIAGVEVSKEPPDALRLVLTERRPAAVLHQGLAWHYVDADGQLIAPLPGEPLPGETALVHLRLGAAGLPEGQLPLAIQRALAVPAELARAQPGWAKELGEVEILSEEDFVLRTGALAFPLFVEAGTVEARVAFLSRLLPELNERYPAIDAVDLRFRDRIVVRPGLAPAPAATAEPSSLSEVFVSRS